MKKIYDLYFKGSTILSTLATKLKEKRGDTNNVSQLGWIGIVAIILVALLVIINRVFPQLANGVFNKVAAAIGVTLTP